MRWIAISLMVAASLTFAALATAGFKVTNYEPGDFPVSVAVADFDRDGKNEIAAANDGDKNVSLAKRKRNGKFKVAKTLDQGGLFTTEAVAGRFNADAKPDLAVVRTNLSVGSVQIYKKKKNGARFGFKPGQTIPVDDFPRDAATLDADRDGNTDIVVLQSGPDRIQVLFGNGDGTFDPPVNQAVGDAPQELAIGRIDGDKRPDIASTNLTGDTITINFPKKNGTFKLAQTVPAGNAPLGIAVANLTADGRNDIAVSSDTGEDVLVLANTGAGLTPVGPFATNGDIDYIAAGQFSGDRRRDIAFATPSGKLGLLLGEPGGGFDLKPKKFDLGGRSSDLKVARVDGGGKDDLVSANGSGDNVAILFGK